MTEKALVTTNSVIEQLKVFKQINGIPLEELESRMQPGSWSSSGFLGKGESLIEVLEADQKMVSSLGLTHEKIADALQAVAITSNGKYTITYNGKEYMVEANGTFCSQDSPFGIIEEVEISNGQKMEQVIPEYDNNLDVFDGTDFEVTNKETGKKLYFAGLLVFLIKKYGFYEGKKVPYRIAPEKIAEFFDLQNKLDR